MFNEKLNAILAVIDNCEKNNKDFRKYVQFGCISEHLINDTIVDYGGCTHFDRIIEIVKHGVGTIIPQSRKESRGNELYITTNAMFVVIKKGEIISLYPAERYQIVEQMSDFISTFKHTDALLKRADENQHWNPEK